MEKRQAILALEDGSVFRGKAFGGNATVVGEAVFNTSMTGYQEILTDPSYREQIITMTAAHVGNYGICSKDTESDAVQVAGFIARNFSLVYSNWRADNGLDRYLKESKCVVEGVATTWAIMELVDRLGVDAPIMSAVHRVLFGNVSPGEAIRDLLSREAGREIVG